MSPSRMRSRVGLLQRRDRPHQRRLSGAVWPEQSEHAGGNVERDVVECTNAVAVRLGETIDDEVHDGGEFGRTSEGASILAGWRGARNVGGSSSRLSASSSLLDSWGSP